MSIDKLPASLPRPFQSTIAQLGEIVLGKERQIRLALACLLARGHLLIEDLPGMGKTTLAQSLAAALGLGFKRIQFTSDLLPADIIGVSIYQPEGRDFRFHPGPLFTQLLLADEINRATPKTQSALLEAMEERQVTADGSTLPLPEPFFVVATQNPSHHIGTFPLPESQLDRFLLCIDMGYPDRAAERAMLTGRDRRELLQTLRPAIDTAGLNGAREAVRRVHASEPLLDYLQGLIAETRRSPLYAQGLSPRAGLGWLHVAQAWAWLEGRPMVVPDDIQAVAPGVLAHRLRPAASTAPTGGQELAARLIESVPVP